MVGANINIASTRAVHTEVKAEQEDRVGMQIKNKSSVNLRVPSRDDVFRLLDGFKGNPTYETAVPFYSAMKHLDKIEGLSPMDKTRLKKASCRAVELLGSYAVAISA